MVELLHIHNELWEREKLKGNLKVLVKTHFRVDPNKPYKRVRKGEVHAILGATKDWKLAKLTNELLVEMGAVIVRNRGRKFFNCVEVRNHGKR